MFNFENTGLWQASFGNPKFQCEDEALKSLRACLTEMRTRVAHLVSTIPKDIPGLTVHDVTHLDALWETASLIAGKDYPLNPAEAFVFGAAVLLHDSAMSLAAYPKGMEEVAKTTAWRDAVASRLIALTGEPLDRSQLANPPESIVKAALADVLRTTHAYRARELPFVEWPAPGGGREMLIEDSDLRNAYGHIIGQIAESHWWPVSQLRDLQPRLNAGAKVPSAWHIDPLKIACLLRVADAAHIDHRRAPRFLRALVKCNSTSAVHWAFQSKLGKPSIDKNFLVYTAGTPFDVSEAEAWWLGYDMLAAIDDELRAVYGALDNAGIQAFIATAVKGSKSPQAVAKLIPTKGWKPVNTELRVSDVPSLVEKLGGQHLYGSDVTAPVRELIQNAADAVTAKRLLTEMGSKKGLITVKLRRTEQTDILEFEDDGIGMSSRVITGGLLDFGRSFWLSNTIREEFPGLLSKGLKTTGRFGIGFFSIFMLGDHVTVTSRRFDAGAADTITLDFQHGLRVRPILREPTSLENLSQPGTRVCVFLRNRYDEPGGLLFISSYGENKNLASLCTIVSRVSPALNVTIEVQEEGKCDIAVEANDWLTQTPEDLLKRARGNLTSFEYEVKSILPNLRSLEDPETKDVYGRACICSPASYFSGGVVTVGGFRASEMKHLVGVLIGEPETAARNSAMPTVKASVLRAWATEQSRLIAAQKIFTEHHLNAAGIVMLCGGELGSLPVAILDGDYLNMEFLVEVLKDIHGEIDVYQGTEIEYDEEDDIRPKAFKNDLNLSPTLFFVPRKPSAILTVGKEQWPACVPDLYLPDQPTRYEDAFHLALERAWGVIEPEFYSESRVVGEVCGEEISREVRVYSRPLDLTEYEK